MKRSLRRFLFYISVLIFAVTGAFLVVYAEGYKFDFGSQKFLKTGSMQLKVNISADIYINDKHAGSTSFFSDAFTKSRLLPKNYEILVQNQDYETWKKNVDIRAGLVTDFPRIVLIPNDIVEEKIASSSFSQISSISFDSEKNAVLVSSGNFAEQINLSNGKIAVITPTPMPSSSPSVSTSPAITPPINQNNGITISKSSKYSVSPDGGKRIWFSSYKIWVEWLQNTNYQPFMNAGNTQLVAEYPNTISDIQWYSDSNHLFLNNNGTLYFIETDIRGGINSYKITGINSPYYYSSSDDAIYKFEGNQLIRVNLNTQ